MFNVDGQGRSIMLISVVAILLEDMATWQQLYTLTMCFNHHLVAKKCNKTLQKRKTPPILRRY